MRTPTNVLELNRTQLIEAIRPHASVYEFPVLLNYPTATIRARLAYFLSPREDRDEPPVQVKTKPMNEPRDTYSVAPPAPEKKPVAPEWPAKIPMFTAEVEGPWWARAFCTAVIRRTLIENIHRPLGYEETN